MNVPLSEAAVALLKVQREAEAFREALAAAGGPDPHGYVALMATTLFAAAMGASAAKSGQWRAALKMQCDLLEHVYNTQFASEPVTGTIH